MPQPTQAMTGTSTGGFLSMAAAIVAAAAITAGASALATVALPQVDGRRDDAAAPIFGVKVPAGYRQWELIAPSQETGKLDELRAIVGNSLALKAYRNGKLPFPDGSVLVKMAWKHVPSAEFDAAFVPGSATTVQVMVKDARRYASTDGWGFGRFLNGKPVDEAQHRSCFPCHQANVKGHDIVFTRLAP